MVWTGPFSRIWNADRPLAVESPIHPATRAHLILRRVFSYANLSFVRKNSVRGSRVAPPLLLSSLSHLYIYKSKLSRRNDPPRGHLFHRRDDSSWFHPFYRDTEKEALVDTIQRLRFPFLSLSLLFFSLSFLAEKRLYRNDEARFIRQTAGRFS